MQANMKFSEYKKDDRLSQHKLTPNHLLSTSSPNHQYTAPFSVAKHTIIPHVEPKTTKYAQKKRNKIAELVKEGVHPEEAERRFLDKQSSYQRHWTGKNIEKSRSYNRKSWSKSTPEQKEKRRDYKRKLYHVRKAVDEAFFDGQVKKAQKPRVQTYEHQHENRIKVNMNKGMSQADAKEAADTYIENVKMKNRLRAKKNSLIRAAKSMAKVKTQSMST